MNWDPVFYYAGYLIALLVCRGLGPLFFVPMLLNMLFNLTLTFGLLGGWDIRWVIAGHGMLFFLWVLVLAGIPNKATFLVLAIAEFGTIFHNLAPELTAIGTGRDFWVRASTNIVNVWLISIFVVTASQIVQGTIWSRIHRGYAELLLVPKQRFLVPIALWSGTIILPVYFQPYLPEWLYQNRFMIASQLLVWGWVAFELPFYLMYKRRYAE